MDDARDAARMDLLLSNLYVALPELEQLLDRADQCPDNNVHAMTGVVEDIVLALEGAAPGRQLAPSAIDLMRPDLRQRHDEAPGASAADRRASGTGEHVVHPSVLAFRQARFYLELAILCGRAGQALPRDLADAATVLGRLFCLGGVGADGARPAGRGRRAPASTARG
jgi:hypothetical protein